MKAFFQLLIYLWLLSFAMLKVHANDFGIRSITLQEAEQRALGTSNEIKAFVAQSNASSEQSDIQFANLLPQWKLSGAFIYDTPEPKIEMPMFGSLPLNIRTIYFVTTEISYPIWDTFSNINAYKSSKFLAQSQKEDEKNTRLQVLYNVRIAYVLVQLSLEQLKSLEGSLTVARAQFSDIDKNYNAGYAAKIDWIAAQREVFNYELQHEQQRSDLNSKVKDLFTLMNLPPTVEIFRSPNNSNDDTTTIQFDPLEKSLQEVSGWHIEAPNENLPSVKSQAYLAKSYDAQADSEWVKLLPRVDLSARATVIGANIFKNKITEVNTFIASVSVPLFDGNRILHTTEQYKQNALSAKWNHDQIKINANRDYQKSLDMIESLKKQKEISKLDIDASQQSAKMYYESYQAGKSIFINVQNANLQFLLAQVKTANITAQILQQLFQIQLLSGKINV